MSELKMPERRPDDGPISVAREGDGLRLRADDKGLSHSMYVSSHNAWRLFGAMALMLGIPLASKVGKAIKL